jgi:hypothetical protein
MCGNGPLLVNEGEQSEVPTNLGTRWVGEE